MRQFRKIQIVLPLRVKEHSLNPLPIAQVKEELVDSQTALEGRTLVEGDKGLLEGRLPGAIDRVVAVPLKSADDLVVSIDSEAHSTVDQKEEKEDENVNAFPLIPKEEEEVASISFVALAHLKEEEVSNGLSSQVISRVAGEVPGDEREGH